MSGTGAQIPAIWARAAARYEEITKKRLLDPVFLSQVKTMADLSTVLEQENSSFTSFRAKRHALFGSMMAAMRPVELALDMAGGDLGNSFPPSSIVFGAVRYLIAAARGVREKYDAIVNLMDALKDFTIRLETYARESISSRLQDKLSEIVVALIEVLALSREEIRHGRLWSYGKGLIGANKEATEAWEKLQRLVEGEKGLVGAETLTEVKGVSVAVTNMETKLSGDMSGLSRQIEALSLVQSAAREEAQDTRTRGHNERLKALLAPTMLSENRFWAINRSRVAGTGD